MPDGHRDDGPRVLLVDGDDRTPERLQSHRDWADATVDHVAGAHPVGGTLADAGYDAVVFEPASVDAGAVLEAAGTHAPEAPVVVYTGTRHVDLPDGLRSSTATLVEKGDLDESVGFLRRKLDGLLPGDGGDGPGPLDCYEVLVEAARDGIYVLDAGGTFQYLNGSLAAMLGYEREELLGAHASTVMAPGELEAGQAVVQGVLEGESDESEVYDMDLVTKDGDPLVVGCHFTVITDDRGAYQGIVGVMRDVTERRRRERELRHQRERLEEFTGIVAHDLRNPMAAALASLEAYQATGEDALVDDAVDAVERMDTLVEDLLALARAGNGAVDAEPVDVVGATERAFDRLDAPDARLQIEDPGSVVADAERLEQLLANLLRNAVEHGSTGPGSQARQNAVDHAEPAVTVTVDGLDGGGFYVADDGPGIPPERREHLLEHGVTTTDDGNGFGLSIVQAVANAHGWPLRIEESDDGGARFAFPADDTVG